MPSAARRNLSEDTYDASLPTKGPEITTLGRIDNEDPVRPKERMKILAAINYLAKLPDDWNGRNARRLSDPTLLSARSFIERMPLDCTYPNKISPDGEGEISFLWKTSEETIIITVDANLLHLSHTHKGQSEKDKFQDDIPFDGEIIPAVVKAEIPKRQRRLS
jgi:hypothetical protein